MSYHKLTLVVKQNRGDDPPDEWNWESLVGGEAMVVSPAEILSQDEIEKYDLDLTVICDRCEEDEAVINVYEESGEINLCQACSDLATKDGNE